MKSVLTGILLTFAGIFALQAKEFDIYGPQGGLAYKISLPEGFRPETDRCPMVILMHGIFSSKDFNPMPAMAKGLAGAGIASIRFDFNGHGKSEGRTHDMTIEKEIADALAIYEYVKALPYVSGIGFLGHSQGGVIASMTAGRSSGIHPLLGFMKLGREYLLTTQDLDIYGTAAAYEGPVCILHGNKDSIVPMWCSERYKETYGDRADLMVVDGENHLISRRKEVIIAEAVRFYTDVFRRAPVAASSGIRK